MDKITGWLGKAAGRHDVVLASMLMVTVVMLILPMPTPLIDILIAINLSFAMVLFVMSIYIEDALQLSAFPSILLITTLYRLALTVSTSRLILLQHDAGEIVSAFGNFVVGGNLAVGIIVFAIVTIVQFIVITKGAERVAEVSARFSLDGMPGKQMSIDNDQRAGTIDAAESKRLRQILQKESQLFGAMDGAMKFVKGDAIASIIVILVNLIGGIVIGVMQGGLGIGEATATYSILSVGDGLVAQIPAIVISVAAGLIVTRVPGEQRQNLGDELARQLGAHPDAFYIAATVLLLCALLPGFPAPAFVLLAALIGGTGWRLKRRAKLGVAKTEKAQDTEKGMKPGIEPCSLLLGSGAAHIDRLTTALDALRWTKFSELGLALKALPYEMSSTLAPGMVNFRVYGQSVCSVHMPEKLGLVTARRIGEAAVVNTETLPFGQVLRWVEPPVAEALGSLGIDVTLDEQRIVTIASLVIDRYAREFVGVQETHYLMSRMEESFPELVKEMQRQMPVGKVAEVLQRLVSEGVSILNMRVILEALIEWAPREKDTVMLVEYVRVALRRQIIAQARGERTMLKVWLVGRSIEDRLRESIRQTAAGSYSSLSPEENEEIVQVVLDAVNNADDDGVLVTAIDTRRFLRKLIEREAFWLPVLSMQELGDDVSTEVIGNIELMREYSDPY